MKILIVEDNEARIEKLVNLLEKYAQIDITKTMEQGMIAVYGDSYDIIFLDHDIENFNMTGTDLARALSKSKPTYKPIIVIHSMNIESAAIMELYLRGVASKVHRIPFRVVSEVLLLREGILQ